jgi:hypothetical protein
VTRTGHIHFPMLTGRALGLSEDMELITTVVSPGDRFPNSKARNEMFHNKSMTYKFAQLWRGLAQQTCDDI